MMQRQRCCQVDAAAASHTVPHSSSRRRVACRAAATVAVEGATDTQAPGLARLREALSPVLLPPHHVPQQQAPAWRSHELAAPVVTPAAAVAAAGPPVLPEDRSHATAAAPPPLTHRASKQLMAEIQAASAVQQLQELYARHHAGMDHVHTACMLNRLAHVWQQQRQQARRSRREQRAATTAAGQLQQEQEQEQAQEPEQELQEQQQDLQQQALQEQQQEIQQQQQADHEAAVALLRVLLADIAADTATYSCRQLCCALWTVGRFHREAAAHSEVQQAVTVLLAALLQHPAAADGPGSEQQQQLDAAPLLQRQGNAADLQQVLWALGRLALVLPVHSYLPAQPQLPNSSSRSPGGSLALLEQLCCQQLAASNPGGQFVANVLCGFAQLHQPVPALFAAVVAKARPGWIKLNMQSQHVVMTVWATAKLGHYDQQLFDALLWRAVVVRAALYPQGVALLLWAAGAGGHVPDPRAVAQLLQVAKARWWQLRGKHLSNLVHGLLRTGCLHSHRTFFIGVLLNQVTVKLHEFSPAGLATLLQAMLALTKPPTQQQQQAWQQRQQQISAARQARQAGAGEAAAAAAAGGGDAQGGSAAQHSERQLGQPQQAEQPPAHARLQRLSPRQLRQQGLHPKQRVSAAAAARAWVGLSVALADGDEQRTAQLGLLLRQMGQRVAALLPVTTPQTLFNITVSLAALGHVDARLYSKLAAAVGAAAASGTDGDSGGGLPFSSCQCLQLLCVFAHFEQPVPELWVHVLPQLVAAPDSWPQLQLVRLLRAAQSAAVPWGAQQMACLLQLAAAAAARQQHEQQQQGASALLTAELVAAATALLQTAAELPGGREVCAGGFAVLVQHTDRLVARLVSDVLHHPQLLPWQGMLRLLHAAVQLQAVGAGDSAQALGHQPSVTTQQLRALADLALAHPNHWEPPPDPADLVTLLQCHTQPPLHNARLAEAYAEELLSRLPCCSVATLVRLLQVLGAAMQQRAGGGYSHSQLVAAACTCLHSKLLQASRHQLAAAATALQQLHQQHARLYGVLNRLLAADEARGEEEGGRAHVQQKAPAAAVAAAEAAVMLVA